MNLRTYRAYSMADALAAVKRDLGPDAVILNTRTSRKGGLFGIGRATIVEVVAVPAEDAAATQRVRQRPANARSAVKAYGGGAVARSAPAPAEDSAGSSEAFSLEREQKKTREFAQAMLDRLEAAGQTQAAAPEEHCPATDDTLAADAAATVQLGTEEDGVETARQPHAVARRFTLQPVDEARTIEPQQRSSRNTGRHSAVDVQPQSAPLRTDSNSEPGFEQMQSELSAIRHMVGQVIQQQRATGLAPPAMPEQLFDYYLKLVAQDLSEELTDQIISEARAELSETELDDAERVRSALMSRLSAYVPCSTESIALESPDDRPLTIALVGPTGVGKTTTLAKLAATMKLQHDRDVGLVTCDTYRIAAVDQLRTYAGIIGLPLEVVLTPAEMQRAMARMQHVDAVLIDTAGRGQRDSGRIDELRQFITAAQPHEVHLVLSSTASEKVLMQEAEAFATVGVDKLVFTKLDEAVSFGMLINVARQLGTQLSFLTTGQEVPDHLECSRPARLAELVLGGALHS